MAKILVVDDETDLEVLIKQKFRKEIRNKEYEFLFAINGLDALEKLLEEPEVDIVLSDINMPEMDGLTLLSKLNEMSPLIQSVIVSAYGDMENIRTAMNRGAFDFITKPINFKDLTLTMEKTLKHARQLRETLRAVKENNILKMYVDQNVLNFMGSREYESAIMVNETVEGTVVFIDICGFTRISEKEPADKVVKMLNAFFDIMVKEIIKQDGVVDKFLGDAIMAFFSGDFHLDRAIETCVDIRMAIENADIGKGIESFKPEVSIGINSGDMVWGNIGSSTLKRLDHTVIGDAVNLAARLQSAAENGQILITEESYEKVKESFKCEKIGAMRMKNRVEPVIAYQVIQ